MPADQRPDLSDPCVVERMSRAFEAAADDATAAELRAAMTAAAAAPTEPARFPGGDECSIYVPPEWCPDIPTCRIHHTVGRRYAEIRAADPRCDPGTRSSRAADRRGGAG